MRQSLSESPTSRGTGPGRGRGAVGAVWSAVGLSVVLAAAALVDQASVHSLSDHATAMYAPYGKDPSHGLLYGLIYTVAGVGVVLWLAVLVPTRSGRRFAPVAAWLVVAITGLLALSLLTATEYGAQIFPPLWGVLAALPPAAGAVGSARLRRRSSDGISPTDAGSAAGH